MEPHPAEGPHGLPVHGQVAPPELWEGGLALSIALALVAQPAPLLLHELYVGPLGAMLVLHTLLVLWALKTRAASLRRQP